MEQIINRLAVGTSTAIGFVVTSGVAFIAFGLAWVAFGAALVISQGSLDAAWAWIRGLPLIVQGLAWLVFLPVVAALWIWETSWPLGVRLVLVGGLAAWSMFIFVPEWARRGG